MNGAQGNNNNNNDNVAQRDIDDMKEIIKRQEERIHNLETKALQLINLYFVFQGVILSSTSSASNLKCCHWRIPFSLSLLATFLNGLAFFVTIYAIIRARGELDGDEAVLVDMRHRLRVDNQGQVAAHEGEGQLQVGENDHDNDNRPRGDSVKKGIRWALGFIAYGLFASFSVVVLYGCVEILCHSGK